MKHVTGQQFKAALEKLGFQTEMAMDDRYFRPSAEWVKLFCEWCRRNPVDYEIERFDCDNITEQQIIEADKANRIRVDATNLVKAADHTLVMCVVDIPQGKDLNAVKGPTSKQVEESGFDFVRHATGLVWCDDGDFYFVERQTGRMTYATFAIDRGHCRPVYSRM